MDPAPRWARRAAWALIALHGALLAAMIPDYFPNIDHAYHAALARQYGEHGTFPWDTLNYAPEGRPNLQGPLLHYAIGGLGRLSGGSGDAYVHSLAVWSFLQWAAAVWTAWWFARRYGGDLAALFAIALLTGSLFSSASFFVGVPSGWIFILTPSAIHFFLEGRIAPAVLFTAGTIYVHLGGISTAPVGVLVAAVLARKWKRLAVVGAATALLAAPYIYHFLYYRAWYKGQRGHVAFMMAPLVYVLAVPGLVRLLKKPREHVFLLAWAAAPAAWLAQDAIRFLLQSSLCGAVIGGMFAAWLWERIRRPRWRAAFAGGLVAVATLAPLSIPSLALELAWDAGVPLPRQLDWGETKKLAGVIQGNGLRGRLVESYFSALGDAIAVYTPVRAEYGHWVEVQPPDYSAPRLSAASKVYILPLAPDDRVLSGCAALGLVRVYGGGSAASVVTMARQGPPEEVAPLAASIVASQADWLARNAVNNRMPPVMSLFSKSAVAERARRMLAQRTAAGRLEMISLIYAWSLEPSYPDAARGMRGAARGFGSLAAFLGDGSTIDFMSDAKHAQLLRNLARVAGNAKRVSAAAPADREFGAAAARLFREYF